MPNVLKSQMLEHGLFLHFFCSREAIAKKTWSLKGLFRYGGKKIQKVEKEAVAELFEALSIEESVLGRDPKKSKCAGSHTKVVDEKLL